MDNKTFPGFGTIEASLRQIVAAINTLNTSISGAFPLPLSGSSTWDPASLTTLIQTTTTITVAGASLGNRVSVSFSLDIQGQTLTSYVSAANTVTVVLFNSTSGTINLGSGTLSVRVFS